MISPTPISTNDAQCKNCGNWIHNEGFYWFEGIWCHNCKDELMKRYDEA